MEPEKQTAAPLAIDPQWRVQPRPASPETPPLALPERQFSADTNVRDLPYSGPRFETQTPHSFQEWESKNRHDLREEGYSLLRAMRDGQPYDSSELLGKIIRHSIGNFIGGEDANADPFETMQRRARGEDEMFPGRVAPRR